MIVNYAYRYGFWPEFIIPPTVPPAPRGPGRWGLRIDLTDFKNYEIYEVEPYSGGVYPPGHGPAQVNHYLQILNQAYGGIGVSFVHNWNPGRYLPDEKFYADPTQFVFVHAWWEQPGVIVYTATLSPKALLVGSEVLLAVLGGRLLKDVIGSRKEPGLAPQGVGICPDNLFPGLITIPSGDMPPGPVEFPPLEFPLEFPLVIP